MLPLSSTSKKCLALIDKHVHTIYRATATANSLQKKNVVSSLLKFHQTEQIQMHTQVPTPTLLLWLGHRMLVWSYLLSLPTLRNRKDFHLYLNKPVAMLWADSTEHLKEKEESSNQYSKLDTRHLPTLRHSWYLQRPVMWLKWFDKNSVTCKWKGKFLGFSENISHFLRQPWESCEKHFSPALLKFFKYIH